MIDKTQVAPAAPANETPAAEISGTHETRFPTEPFACPNCGQMLGPNVRVCVACRQPIDPSRIRAVTPSPTPAIPQFSRRAQPQVRFPWGVFVVFLVLGSVMTSEGAAALGALKALLVIGAIQVLSSIWVFYDAHQKSIPKPLYWGIGSLFFWLPIFSWYLVRRRQSHAACPAIEAGGWQFLRTLILIFAVTTFLTLLMSLIIGKGVGPAQKPQPSPTSDRGGSIALQHPAVKPVQALGTSEAAVSGKQSTPTPELDGPQSRRRKEASFPPVTDPAS